MNQDTLLEQEHKRLQIQNSLNVCISLSSQHCGLLIEFLVNQSINFSASSSPSTQYQELLPTTPTLNEKRGYHQAPESCQQILEGIYQKYISAPTNQIPLIAKIAEEAGWNSSTFKVYFKQYYGKSFYQLYMEKRMEYAARLLQQGYRANKVSAMVGYGEKSCIKFNKMFQKHFGITPKKYQMNQK